MKNVLVLTIHFASMIATGNVFAKAQWLKAQFALQEIGGNTEVPIVWVNFKCSNGDCIWIENRIQGCLGKEPSQRGGEITTDIFTTQEEGAFTSRMKVTTNADGNYSVSIDLPAAPLNYALKLDCPKSGVMIHGCSVKSISGSHSAIDAVTGKPIALRYEIAKEPIKNGHCLK